MFQQFIAIIRASCLPQKLLRQYIYIYIYMCVCVCVLWMYMDYNLSSVASCRGTHHICWLPHNDDCNM
jgi:hypothetical protein